MHIAIAGNIGSGKTTLATLLARHLGYDVKYEDPSENPYISDFYSEMQRWSFNLQVYFLHSRLHQTIEIQRSDRNTVQDRTMYEDADIFAPNLLAMGLLAQRDYDTYRALFDTVIQLVRPPDLVIYLRASVPTLADMILSRDREFEDTIRLDYLKRLNDRYDEWYDQYKLGKKMEVAVDELNFRDNREHLGIILQRVSAELFGLFQF
jgi:deoxyadenosine/deoxycytidine kinase